MKLGKIFVFLSALSIGGALVVSTLIATRGLVRVKTGDQLTISVTGSAKRQIRSDQILWHATVSSQADTMTAAYQQLAKQVPVVVQYLVQHGVPTDQITVLAVDTSQVHPRDKDGQIIPEKVIAYEMTQGIQVRSGHVDKVSEVARTVTELINQGISITSSAPQYLYTKLGELKISMLEEAAKDARVRAERIATSTGSKIGVLRSARMGVIQVNPIGQSEVSDTGVNDTSSLEKEVMTVVAAVFSIE